MYLINYIYFKGKWEIPFDPKETKEDQFHVDDNTTVPVQMMYKEDDFHVFHDEEISTHVLQLHYNESVSMMLVLPEKGLQGLEEVVCKNHLRKWIRSVEKSKYKVFVPKLSLKTSYQLKDILSEMGITDILGGPQTSVEYQKKGIWLYLRLFTRLPWTWMRLEQQRPRRRE
ncbi:hypothetical protein ANANG_G00197330 [Anguilla anguilla]|uniref:Thyroxine-binding globulin n=1 Tax=Anguilla anguilla TaxID=7936 RepID=A0A9D3RSC7_ANGAN|nr:hypothetical protein ANANG_G00197330 [Anguilla anguilla]